MDERTTPKHENNVSVAEAEISLEGLSPTQIRAVELVRTGHFRVVQEAMSANEVTLADFMTPQFQEAVEQKVTAFLSADDPLAASMAAEYLCLNADAIQSRDFQKILKEAIVHRLQSGDLNNLDSVLHSLPLEKGFLQDNATKGLVERRVRERLAQWHNSGEVITLLENFPISSEVLREPINVENAMKQLTSCIYNRSLQEAQKLEQLVGLKPAEVEKCVTDAITEMIKLGSAQEVAKVLQIWPLAHEVLQSGDMKKNVLTGMDRQLKRPVGIEFAPIEVKTMIQIFGFKPAEFNTPERRNFLTNFKEEVNGAISQADEYLKGFAPDYEGIDKQSWIDSKTEAEEAWEKMTEIFSAN